MGVILFQVRKQMTFPQWRGRLASALVHEAARHTRGTSLADWEHWALSHKFPAGSFFLGWREHVRNCEAFILHLNGVSKCSSKTLQSLMKRFLRLWAGYTYQLKRNYNFVSMPCLCDSKSGELLYFKVVGFGKPGERRSVLQSCGGYLLLRKAEPTLSPGERSPFLHYCASVQRCSFPSLFPPPPSLPFHFLQQQSNTSIFLPSLCVCMIDWRTWIRILTLQLSILIITSCKAW